MRCRRQIALGLLCRARSITEARNFTFVRFMTPESDGLDLRYLSLFLLALPATSGLYRKKRKGEAFPALAAVVF